MGDDWRADLRASALAFVNVVWPVLGPHCGAGRLQPVELSNDDAMRNDLDIHAGIDAWQVVEGKGMRGIASRIQETFITCEPNGTARELKPFNTFTVRRTRTRNAFVEFEKRIRALQDQHRGWIYPHLSIHAYISPDRQSFRSGAVTRTEDLYRYILHHRAAIERRTSPNAIGWVQQTHNATFFAVSFDTLVSIGADVVAVVNGQVQHGAGPRRLNFVSGLTA